MGYEIPEQSDGEAAVQRALERLGLRYEVEKEIHFLEGDSKSHRRADFYLPDKRVYIEYLGGWNNEENKYRYYKKKKVYKENGIKCIYLHPNQLNNLRQAILKGIEKIEQSTEQTNTDTHFQLTHDILPNSYGGSSRYISPSTATKGLITKLNNRISGNKKIALIGSAYTIVFFIDKCVSNGSPIFSLNQGVGPDNYKWVAGYYWFRSGFSYYTPPKIITDVVFIVTSSIFVFIIILLTLKLVQKFKS